jgi:pentatricopeptide repeat protein
MTVHRLNLTPDEGACIDVLHTAARHGLPELASDVLRILKRMGASWQEPHFAALIEALCRAGRIKDAFLTLDMMKSRDVKPAFTTTSPIFDIISKDVDALDAAWSIIEEIHKEGNLVGAEMLNVVTHAAISLSDLQRALGIYKTYAEYGVKPTVETFNLLLAGCVVVSHRELGDRLLGEMKEAKLRPNSSTYENMILLCLTQDTYEDAFFYLEEMKAGKHIPSSTVYEALVQTCLTAGDSRYKLALEEMKQCGYGTPQQPKKPIDDAYTTHNH